MKATTATNLAPGVHAVNDRLAVSTLRDRDGDESDDRIAFALRRSLARLQAAGNDVEKISIDGSPP